MQYMNSSPSMTMVMQPSLCPPPPARRGWQPLNSSPPYGQYERPSSAPYYSQQNKPVQKYRDPRPAWQAANNGSYDNSMQYDVTITPHRPPSRPQSAQLAPQPPRRSGAGMAMSGTLTVYPRVENGKVVTMQPYDPLYDPHLADFFAKKFNASPQPPPKRSWSSSGHRPPGSYSFSKTTRFSADQPPYISRAISFHNSSSRKSNDKKKSVDYKVTVRTGDKQGAGTDARVYIRLVGQRGKVPKWRLFKKSGQSNNKTFRFAKGTSHIFKHKGGDIGQIQKVIIEHDGISERDSWFLKEVVVEDLKHDRSYTFPCDRWLSLFKEDCQLTRQLCAVSGKQANRTTYEITTVTGVKRGAGTDANVFVTLYGAKGTSPKLHLGSDSKSTFERGQSDVFKMRTVNVGKLKKMRVEIDNQGFAPAWYLDRVVVVDLMKPRQRVYFPCGQWLSDDEQMYRDLMGSTDIHARAKMNNYVVHTFTGDKRGAGTDSNVTITLFGDMAESGSITLDNSKNNFERGRKDTFNIECPHVGKLKKIRIGHDNEGLNAGWFLDKVVIDDTTTNRVITFPCQRWFAKDEDDGRITRELVAGVGDAGIPYTVQLFTGNQRGAGTDAEVYIILYGGKKGDQTSGKVVLDGKFERNRVDVCNIECASLLSPLKKIEVGHDNSGLAAGWYLEKVVVTCNSNGCEQVFNCRQWFATDEGDGLIIRELYEDTSQRKQVQQKSAWNCSIWTSDIRNAGTDANVYIQVYGEKGKSDQISLKNETDNFETGQKDQFKIDFPDLGKLYKLRVWHDDSRQFSGWHLDKIVLEPVTTGKKSSESSVYTFKCQKWLDTKEGDGEIIRELPATGQNVKRAQPLLQYTVLVTTGDKRGAGTDADVFCCLYGSQGDTGDRPLVNSKTNTNKFERNDTDEFVIEAVTLKGVNKIKVGHNNSGPGAGWFLDNIVVRGEDGDHKFVCGRWLATDEDDGAIVREITEEGTPQLLNTTTYHISVKTGDVRGGGTDANVYIKIYGENGDTGKLQLHQSDNIRNKFERNRTDLFKLEATDIGKIERIYIGHDDSGVGSGWFLDGLEINVPSTGYHYTFYCHRWLATDEGDCKTEVELYPTQTREQDKLLPYEITVNTGDILNAGTDAKVVIQLYGEDGKSEVIPLRNRTDNFERKAVDKFKIESKDVGPISKIRIGHDGRGIGSGWFLDSVKIQRFVKKTSKRKKRRRESVSSKDNMVETYWFVCKRWFDKSEDDGQIIRELVPTDEQGNPIDDALQELDYNVSVYTGDKRGAGTDSNVFMTLYGEMGDSGERKLEKSESNINKFERNQVDIFSVKAADLKDLKKLKIRHDNSVLGSAWFLDRIEVKSKDQTWVFPCQRWLSTSEDDGQIERTLVPVDQATYARLQQQKQDGRKASTAVKDAVALETKAQLTTYEVTVKTGDVWSGGTDANVYLVLFGEKDDSGMVNLKTSKTHRDKFERNKSDVFTVESADLGDLKKIKIGHDNAGINAGWYLQLVDIDAPSMGKKWKFPCGKWLAKDKDDGKLERELYPSTDETVGYQAKVPYEITTYTSDVSGAGTDADVFIVLYGRDGVVTEQTSLCQNKDDRKSKFKKKAVDTFVLELDDVGETIDKIRIGHNGKGWGAGWHLDKVEVRRLLDNKKGSETYLFTCGRWLARDEDDGEIVRELVPTQVFKEQVTKAGKLKRSESRITDSLKKQQYKVHVFTGDVFNAGTDANVYIVIFGQNGDSGERKLLKSETYTDKFERGHEDVFNLEAVDLGKLFKVHIRHDNAMLNPAWFLGKVEIEDGETGERFVFHCERWLSKSKDDGKIARSLYVVGYDGETSTKRSLMTTKSGGSSWGKRSVMSDVPEGPTIPYTIKVRTGSEQGSSCNANGFIKIHGGSREKKTTRRIVLEAPSKKFKKGTVETFNVDAIDVGSIKSIEIGHTGIDAVWFIEDVMIDQPTKGKSFTFNCKMWFARNRGDGLTTRTLNVNDAEKVVYQAKLPYEVTLVTGDKQRAGTDCLIKLSIYGAKGNAPDILIRKSEEDGVLLERGSKDVVNIEIDQIAPFKMIRIEHDGKGQRPDWFCEKVELRNLNSGTVTVFQCNQWLSKTMGDQKLSRELAASVKGKSALKTTTYTINVKTSNIRGAGTNANVRCILFGQFGDSGELQLKESENHKNKFEKDATDVFVFNDKFSLGELHKVRVWHDAKGFSSGWHLEYIEVVDAINDGKFMFPCNRWLADDEDDKQIIRELTCSNLQSPGGSKGKMTYSISVATSNKRDAAPSSDPWIMLIGKGGVQSRKTRIENIRGRRKNLAVGESYSFKVETKDLGSLEEIVLGLSEIDRWHVSDVLVESSTGAEFGFPCHAWVNNKDGRDTVGRTFPCASTKGRTVSIASLTPVKYEVTVVTADEKGAGTDANVCITIYGENGDSGKRVLKQRFRDLFERKQTDKFNLEILDLGNLSKVRLEHDDAGFNSDWLCDHVIIKNPSSGKSWIFVCREWIGNKKGNQLYRDVLPRKAD